MFFGIIVRMYFYDTDKHHLPHLHAEYSGNEVVVALETFEVLEGSIPTGKLRLLLAWMEIHHDDLMADWKLVSNGEPAFRVEPLKG
jgi:hypothetical protein